MQIGIKTNKCLWKPR